MIVRLPVNKPNATGSLMRGKLTVLMLMFAILACTVDMSTIAHAQAAATGHGCEVLANSELEASNEQDQQKSDSEKPCHTAAHHHCCATLRADVPALSLTSTTAQLRAIPLSH